MIRSAYHGWVAFLGEVDEGTVEWSMLVPRPLSRGTSRQGGLGSWNINPSNMSRLVTLGHGSPIEATLDLKKLAMIYVRRQSSPGRVRPQNHVGGLRTSKFCGALQARVSCKQSFPVNLAFLTQTPNFNMGKVPSQFGYLSDGWCAGAKSIIVFFPRLLKEATGS